MEGHFSQMQPKLENKYVMLDFDETASINPEKFIQIIHIIESMGLIVKVFTARNENGDNSDIFTWFNKEKVLFANGQQKKDALWDHGIRRDQVAFWIDDSPSAIVDKEDIGNLMGYFNS